MLKMINEKLVHYAYLPGDETKDSAIADAIVEISHILNEQRYSDYDELLKHLDIKKVSISMMLSFLRVSFMIRNEISEWFPFLTKAMTEVSVRGKNPYLIFKGLYIEPKQE